MDPRFREGDKVCAMRLFASSAARLHVTRQAMSALLNGHAGLSAEMAIRFEKAFGLKADTMLRMQVAYDLAQARAREGNILVQRVADRWPCRYSGKSCELPLRLAFSGITSKFCDFSIQYLHFTSL